MSQITYQIGNITQANQRLIAHGCNSRGKFASGVAKSIREAFPVAFEEYMIRYSSIMPDKAYNESTLKYGGRSIPLGSVIWAFSKGKFIANCITQLNYGNDGQQYVDYPAIKSCLVEVYKKCKEEGIDEVAMPKIGAGLGGGNWGIISCIIESTLHDVKTVVYVLDKSEIPSYTKE